MRNAPGVRTRSMAEMQMIDHAAVKQLQSRVAELEKKASDNIKLHYPKTMWATGTETQIQADQSNHFDEAQLSEASQNDMQQFIAGVFERELRSLAERLEALENRMSMMPKRAENTARAEVRQVERETTNFSEALGDFREEILRLSQRMTELEKEVRSTAIADSLANLEVRIKGTARLLEDFMEEVREGYQKRRGRKPGVKR